MKVFYIASNPEGADELALEREITALQRRSAYASGEPVEFKFLPDLPVEQLPLELLVHKPDIVHFSGHATSGELVLANERHDPVTVTGPMLRSFLNYERPPKLVYFNACNSQELAKAVIDVVPAAIGTTAMVTNAAARASAVAFYDRVIHGGSLGDAFDVGRHIIEALQEKSASSVLEIANGFDARTHRFHTLPRIVARSASGQFRFTRSGMVTVECFLIGCPSNTAQVVFFTDDEGFYRPDPRRNEPEVEFLARSLCQVVRSTPRRGRIEGHVIWTTCEDFRIFACGTTAGGETFTVASTLCDALQDYAQYLQGIGKKTSAMKGINEAVARLLDPDQISEQTERQPAGKRKSMSKPSGQEPEIRQPVGTSKGLPSASNGRAS
jgi:hypothetical protein